ALPISVDKARKNSMEVIWVQHNDEELVKDSEGWKLCPPLTPAASESVFHKNFNSSFEKTELEANLRNKGIDHLYICGAATNWCVRATTFAAIEKGFKVTIIEDAHTTGDVTFKDGFHISAEAIVTDFNMNAIYLNYADKKLDALKTIDFLNSASPISG